MEQPEGCSTPPEPKACQRNSPLLPSLLLRGLHSTKAQLTSRICEDDMKAFIAIVKNTGAKVDKYLDFDTQAEANAHVSEYGGYVVANPGGILDYWTADADAKTLVYEQATRDSDVAMQEWSSSMAATDQNMPRISEDIIDSMDAIQKARLPQLVRDNHAAKKTLRGQRPA